MASRKKLAPKSMQIVGLVVALAAAGGVFLYDATNRQEVQPMRPVVVAVDNIPVSTILDANNRTTLLIVVDQLAATVPDEAFTSLSEIPANAVVTLPIAKGAPLINNLKSAYSQLSKVISPTGNNGLSTNSNLTTTEGLVAYALNVGETGTLAAGLQPGDSVDIIVSYTQKATTGTPTAPSGAPGTTSTTGVGANVASNSKLLTKLLLQNVFVLSIGSNYVPQPATQPKAANAAPPAASNTIVTLAVSRDDAVLLKFLKDDGATLEFVLRPVGDKTKLASPPSASSESVLPRFAK